MRCRPRGGSEGGAKPALMWIHGIALIFGKPVRRGGAGQYVHAPEGSSRAVSGRPPITRPHGRGLRGYSTERFGRSGARIDCGSVPPADRPLTWVFPHTHNWRKLIT